MKKVEKKIRNYKRKKKVVLVEIIKCQRKNKQLLDYKMMN